MYVCLYSWYITVHLQGHNRVLEEYPVPRWYMARDITRKHMAGYLHCPELGKVSMKSNAVKA